MPMSRPSTIEPTKSKKKLNTGSGDIAEAHCPGEGTETAAARKRAIETTSFRRDYPRTSKYKVLETDAR